MIYKTKIETIFIRIESIYEELYDDYYNEECEHPALGDCENCGKRDACILYGDTLIILKEAVIRMKKALNNGEV